MAVDWQAVGAVSTAGAAIVALVPIFRAAAASKAKAKNLRMRVAVKLQQLRPSIAKFFSPSAVGDPTFVQLSDEELERKAVELEALLSDSDCLHTQEQDRISQVVANFQLMFPAMKARQLPPAGAESMLVLIDRAITELEENGLLHHEPEQPWESR